MQQKTKLLGAFLTCYRTINTRPAINSQTQSNPAAHPQSTTVSGRRSCHTAVVGKIIFSAIKPGNFCQLVSCFVVKVECLKLDQSSCQSQVPGGGGEL